MRCFSPGCLEGPNMRPRIVLRKWIVASCLLLLGCVCASAQATAPCGGDFGAWLQGVKTEAAAQGISQRAIQSGLGGITPDPAVIAHDHAQGVFRQSFEQFSGRMIPPRLARGAEVLAQYGPIFSQIAQQYGLSGGGTVPNSR